MRNIFAFFIVATILFFVSCHKPSKLPSEVAIDLYTALTSGEVDVVKNNIYIADTIQRKAFDGYLDIVASSEQYRENIKDFVPSYTVASETVEGDNAEVILVGKGPLGQKLRITVRLLLVDGEWKVDGQHGVWHR